MIIRHFYNINPQNWLLTTNADVAAAQKKALENPQMNEKDIEEYVRQWVLLELIETYGYPKEWLGERIVVEETVQICNYCGSSDNLALDHIFPQRFGGKDNAENLIFACRSCNSSKGKKDLMEWMDFRGKFLPLMIIRRYLKLTFNYCLENDLIDKKIEELNGKELPFKIDLLPTSYPSPNELILNIGKNKNAI